MFRVYGIVLFLATITVSYEAPTQSIEPDQEEPQIMCKDGYCGKIRYDFYIKVALYFHLALSESPFHAIKCDLVTQTWL